MGNQAGLLKLLILLHLVHGALNAGRSVSPQRSAATPPITKPQPSPVAQAPRMPQAQGAYGVAQGHNGMLAQTRGGLPSLQNNAGMFPHQQNPYLFMAGKA